MERFYIITNNLKDPDHRVTQEMKSYIVSHGKTCLLCDKDEDGHIIQERVPKAVDCAIVLGGDGTLIRAARELKNHSIPLLGVNMGTLGYLAEVELPNYKEALCYLFEQMPEIENRMMMQGNISGSKSEENVAMNDIVITREGTLRIVHFNVYVNGMLLSSYQADGIIVSTPTGSTGTICRQEDRLSSRRQACLSLLQSVLMHSMRAVLYFLRKIRLRSRFVRADMGGSSMRW